MANSDRPGRSYAPLSTLSFPSSPLLRLHSWPTVTLQVAYNSTFAILALAGLLASERERPLVPIRLWMLGYALQCLLHVWLVCFEYRRRLQALRRASWGPGSRGPVDGDYEDYDDEYGFKGRVSRIIKKLVSLNGMVSMLWWLLGLYWVVIGGQALTEDAPCLYWLTLLFLSFDMIFTIFCVSLAISIGISLCCCLPCIIAFLNTVELEDGASDAYLSHLHNFRFRQLNQPDHIDLEKGHGDTMLMDDQNSLAEVMLPAEDSECCICLAQYEDGAELTSLPCHHYFHSNCINKWLRINATCPLCKYNIIKDVEHGSFF